MRKGIKTVVIITAVILIIWVSMFAVDFIRCRDLKEPIFAYTEATADDGGSGLYKGLGYTVEIEKHIDAEYGVRTDYAEMRLFGILVQAIIVD